MHSTIPSPANQERFRRAVIDNTAVVAKKQLYQVKFDKVVEDTSIVSLENSIAPAKRGQWIATRLNPDGTPNIEIGINSWVTDDKTILKSYSISNVEDLTLPQLTLWTKSNAPPVVAVEVNESGKFLTPFGAMQFEPGDRIINYDFNSMTNAPGINFARVTATSWKQTYETIPMKQ